jgi:hypothetical protein
MGADYFAIPQDHSAVCLRGKNELPETCDRQRI